MKISARSLLVIFPGEYTLKEAYELVAKWAPDSINYDTVNGKQYILAKKSVPMAAFVKKLIDRGVVFKAGKDLKDFIIPHLSFNSIPVDSSSTIPNNTPQNPTISPEFKELLTEVVRDACASKNIDGNIDENISSQIENLKSQIENLKSTLKARNSDLLDRERTINSLKISLKESKDQMGSSIASLNDQLEGHRDTINQKNEQIQSLLDQLKSYQPDPTDTRDTTDAPTDTRDTTDAPTDTRDTSDTDDPEAKYQDINAIVKLAAEDMAVRYPGFRIGVDRLKNSSGTITGAIVFLRKGGTKSSKKTYSFTNDTSFGQWLLDNY